MTRASRDKGARREREIMHLLPGAEKISFAWGAGPDLTWRGRLGEVKARADGWRRLYTWLEDVSFLFLKSDRRDWLVVMRVEELLDLVDEAYTGGIDDTIAKLRT